MSGQDWNTVLNRVLAVQAAEADVARAQGRLDEAKVALNGSIARDDLEWDENKADLKFVIDGREYTVTVPWHLLGKASVRERLLNVITLNK